MNFKRLVLVTFLLTCSDSMTKATALRAHCFRGLGSMAIMSGSVAAGMAWEQCLRAYTGFIASGGGETHASRQIRGLTRNAMSF